MDIQRNLYSIVHNQIMDIIFHHNYSIIIIISIIIFKVTIFQKIIEILLQIYFKKESGAKKEFIVYDVKQYKKQY